MIKLFKIRTTTYDFFVTVKAYLHRRTLVAVLMLLGPGINAAMRTAN